MSRASEAGTNAWVWVQYVDWYYNMEALVRAPFIFFEEYVPDAQREYARGNVIKQGNCKWLFENWGKLDPDIPLNQQPLLKLFRDSGQYDYFPGEYCLKGFIRYYHDQDPERAGWYIVISERVDSKTPPPNDYQSWEKVLV